MSKRRFRLDRANGKFMGVCAGIADYSGIDATFVRIAAVVLTIFGGFPWTLVAYGAAALLAGRATAANEDRPVARLSTREFQEEMRDIDRRMAEIETYVTASNTGLAREIDALR